MSFSIHFYRIFCFVSWKFWRAAQRMANNNGPVRSRVSDISNTERGGFCGALQRLQPSMPAGMARRLANKENYGLGKVSVQCVSNVDVDAEQSFYFHFHFIFHEYKFLTHFIHHFSFAFYGTIYIFYLLVRRRRMYVFLLNFNSFRVTDKR